jgi:3',5'-cyclic AMP phosphodiesterase CpdA
MAATIVQFTDLHLTARQGDTAWGADVWANLRRAIAHVRAHGERPDLLVLTGDLANRPRPSIYLRLRELVAGVAVQLRVLPGNHDSRRQLRAAFAELLPPTGPADFALDLAGWRIVGLDTQQWPFVFGRLGGIGRRRLRAELQTGGAPVLAFGHHPLNRVGCWWLDKDRLRDRRHVGRIVRGSALRAYVCGHVHQASEGEFAGVPVWTTPSVAYQFRPRALWPDTESLVPAYRVITLDGDQLATQVVRLRG